MSEENKNSEEKKTFREFMKELFGGAQLTAPTANFSAADAETLVANAVKAATENITADFTAKLDAKDTVINALRDDVNKQTSTGKRAEIVSFVEAIPAEKGKHFFEKCRNRGIYGIAGGRRRSR